MEEAFRLLPYQRQQLENLKKKEKKLTERIPHRRDPVTISTSIPCHRNYSLFLKWLILHSFFFKGFVTLSECLCTFHDLCVNACPSVQWRSEVEP